MQNGNRRRMPAPGVIHPNQIYHVVGTYDGETQRLYVNGTLVASGSVTSGPPSTNSNALYIGSWDGEEEFFKGTIDEVAVYATTLSEAQIAAHYTAGSGEEAPPSYSAAVLTDNPVSYWRLGESSGTTAADESGANPGTYLNSPTLGAPSLLASDTADTAVSFDGVNDTVKVPSSPSLELGSTLSLEAWIKPKTALPSSGTFASVVTKAESYSLQFNGPNIEFTIMQNGNRRRMPAPGVIHPNQIYHVVGTYDGETQRLYVNGTLVASGSVTSGPPSTNSNALYIGSWDGEEEFFKGTIDEVAVYDTTLSPARVAAHYAAGVDPPQTTITSPTPSYTGNETWPVDFTSNEPGSSFTCTAEGYFEPLGWEPIWEKPCESPLSVEGPPDASWIRFSVAAIDEDGNVDPTPASWTFSTSIYPHAPSTSKLISPDEGDKTGSYFTLQSEWGNAPPEGGISGLTYQIKLPYWSSFRDIPSEYVTNDHGDEVSWPIEVTENPTKSSPVFFDVKAYGQTQGWDPPAELQVRAIFDGSREAAGASAPVNVMLSRFVGGASDAMEAVGPLNVDLVTGSFTVSRTDVSIPVPGTESTLEFTRVYNSAYGANETTNSNSLGAMWQPSAPVESEYEEEAWQKLLVQHRDRVLAKFEQCSWHEAEEGEVSESCGECDEGQCAPCPEETCEQWMIEEEVPEQNWVEVLDSEGAGIPFERTGEGPYAYVPPEEAREFALSNDEEVNKFILEDSNHTDTEFSQNPGTNEYVPSRISFQGSAKDTRLTYGIAEGKQRLESIIGPAPADVTCDPLEGQAHYAPKTAGCRSLYLGYGPYQKGSGERLLSIVYYDSSGSESGHEVAEYEYDEYGQLIKEWEPRLPNLAEEYDYEGSKDARLKSLAPPGVEPWEFSYYPVGSDGAYEAKLRSVSRASLLENGSKTATTTLAYDVPVSGEGAPYELSPEALAEWDDADFPVDATAVFPPTEVPAEEPGDYDQARIHYMDPEGHEVNIASPSPPGVEGDSITTAETDAHGNVIRELSAQNRLAALEDKSPAARSHELDSHSIYNEEGARMLESWGPVHEVRLESSGETVQARQHTIVEYDKGYDPPSPGVWPNLPTKETVAAAVANQGDVDARVTQTYYDWNLLKPTEEVVDPDGLDIATKTAYNSAGQVIEERQPEANAEGSDPHTILTSYYTAGGDGTCGANPKWAGLPCITRPFRIVYPGDSSGQLATHFSAYSSLDQPTEIRESRWQLEQAPYLRTTTNAYDTAGRPTQTHTVGPGAEVPAVSTSYSPTTGAPVSQQLVCEKNAKTSTPNRSPPPTTPSAARSNTKTPTAMSPESATTCSGAPSRRSTARARRKSPTTKPPASRPK